MAISPEVTGGAGAVIGGILVYVGKYFWARLTANGNGNSIDEARPRLPVVQPQCPDHPHLSAKVDELCTRVDTGFNALHEKVNATRESVARVEGMLSKSKS